MLAQCVMGKFFQLNDIELKVERAKEQVWINKTKPNDDLKTLVSNNDVTTHFRLY